MDEMTFNSVTKYFNHLSNTGYFSQSNVNKLLLLILIQEFIDNDFRGLITEEDYNYINKALYCLYGSSCLIPYPDYYNTKRRRIMYTGSISELVHRVETLEESISLLEDKEVVVPDDESQDQNNFQDP